MENICAIDRRGSGKSYAIRALSSRRARVVYVDPTSTGTDVFVDTSAHAIALMIREEPVYRATWRCGHLSPKDMRTGLTEIVIACESSQCVDTIIVDELGVLLDKQPHTALERALRTGRHTRVSVWLATQRAVDLPPTYRQAMDHTLVFGQTEAIDQARLDQIHRGLGSRAARLDDREFLLVSNRGEITGPHTLTPRGGLITLSE